MKPEEVKIGTPVIYWGIIKDNGQKFDPFKTEIMSDPWSLGHGELVCKVKGKSGGVSLRHLAPVNDETLAEAKLQPEYKEAN